MVIRFYAHQTFNSTIKSLPPEMPFLNRIDQGVGFLLNVRSSQNLFFYSVELAELLQTNATWFERSQPDLTLVCSMNSTMR